MSSPRIRGNAVSISRGVGGTERGVQVKASVTTREIQTGQFTKECATETNLVKFSDASTQKKLRKPKQRHFSHQFTGKKTSVETQVERLSVTAGTQWDEKHLKNMPAKLDKLAKVRFYNRRSSKNYMII